MKLTKKSQHILSLFNQNKILILASLYYCRDNVCGCDLVDNLKVPKNLISYHIKTLREAGVIEETRCGKNKRYQITKVYLSKVEKILEILELRKE